MTAPPSAVLLVTGSRALHDAALPLAGAWARAVLDEATDALPRGGVVITGDADGPDTWARHAAALRSVARHVYSLDGRVYCYPSLRSWPWSPTPREATSYTPREWPLVRNEFLIADAANLARYGVPVYVLALHAPWSRTAGTLHTARLAMRAGLWCDVRECPAALGPREARP